MFSSKLLTTLCAAVLSIGIITTPTLAAPVEAPAKKVMVCVKTSSAKNPNILVRVSEKAAQKLVERGGKIVQNASECQTKPKPTKPASETQKPAPAKPAAKEKTAQ